jgi:hypothetical protein
MATPVSPPTENVSLGMFLHNLVATTSLTHVDIGKLRQNQPVWDGLIKFNRLGTSLLIYFVNHDRRKLPGGSSEQLDEQLQAVHKIITLEVFPALRKF